MKRENNLKFGPTSRSLGMPFSRREFFRAAGAASAAISAGFGSASLGATESPRVSEQGPMAKALNYVHDARSVDAAKRSSSSFCNNCALFAGNENADWSACSVFPGKLVAGEGWCSAWAPRQQK